jgi:cytochrome c oxidase subunit 3
MIQLKHFCSRIRQNSETFTDSAKSHGFSYSTDFHDLSMSGQTVSQGDFVLRVSAVYLGAVICAAAIAMVLCQVFGLPTSSSEIRLPLAFHVSTLVLLAGSWQLHQATSFVRVEKQAPFRRSLMLSLATGTLFVGIQGYGIWCLTSSYPQNLDTQTNAHGFIFVFVALHAMHFSVAMMFLVFVTLRGMLDRYDHEYYWGVTVCEWFWHILGIVWLAILTVFAIAV